MSSDSEEEYDITKNLAFVGGSDDEVDSSDDGSSFDEIQDEILSDDDEGEETEVKPKPQPKAVKRFPKLEVGDEEEDLEQEGKFFGVANGKKLNAGTFAGMGLSKVVLSNISRSGFKHPTPIQRKAIPPILEGRDVVGMARTGSGKTAAFVLPMIEKLKVHSARVGARALILSPSRELALQTMKVVKTFSKNTDLRSVLLVGGDSMEEQFNWMMSNPDIIIATPGRFMHLKVEMQLDLKSIEYICFDEADRLFELGFSEQLNEVLGSLSPDRQSLLFSATLPKSLVEFAKAGLTDPLLIRLDAESKVPENLELAFFSIRDGEKDAALIFILDQVINMPLVTEEQKRLLAGRQIIDDEENEDEDEKNPRKRKRKFERKRMAPANELPSPHSTIVFVPTKHHVEYVYTLLQSLGYACSYIYGTLDQTARKEQLYRFRAGIASVMVVTDIAARGLDIPVLANVINYSLPSSPKVFVHRVGRTARAGRKGWAYSIIRDIDLPYLLDLEVFLGRKLMLPLQASKELDAQRDISYNERLVVGSLPRDLLELQMEHVETLLNRDYDLNNLKIVALRGEKLYNKTKGSASKESVKRSKQVQNSGWNDTHCLFGKPAESLKQEFLDRFSNRKNKETVFEIKKMNGVTDLMARRRKQIAPIQEHFNDKKSIQSIVASSMKNNKDDVHETGEENGVKRAKLDKATEEDIADAFGSNRFRDSRFFMSHYESAEAAQEKGYSLNEGGFASSANTVSFDLNGEGSEFTKKQGMRWDKKKGKYVNAGGEDNKKFIKGENGAKIPASFRSGKYDQWKAAHKSRGVVVGSAENESQSMAGRRFKHHQQRAPKPADKARDDYKGRKARVSAAVDKGMKVKGMPMKGHGQNLQSLEQMHKQRMIKEKRREKNNRPSKKGKGRK